MEFLLCRPAASAPTYRGSKDNARRAAALFAKPNLMHRVFSFFCTVLAAVIPTVSLICSGCASHTYTVRPRQRVQIVSQPPGAQIEVNGQYVGDAPTTVEVETSTDGHFWRDTIIKAYPKETGYTQIRVFNGKSRWAISDLVPSRIFFDTRVDPSAAFQSNR